MATTEQLTEREQQALEQMREAQELGSTLKDHAAKIGLDVRELYELRRRLVRKGAFGPPPPRCCSVLSPSARLPPILADRLPLEHCLRATGAPPARHTN